MRGVSGIEAETARLRVSGAAHIPNLGRKSKLSRAVPAERSMVGESKKQPLRAAARSGQISRISVP